MKSISEIAAQVNSSLKKGGTVTVAANNYIDMDTMALIEAIRTQNTTSVRQDMVKAYVQKLYKALNNGNNSQAINRWFQDVRAKLPSELATITHSMLVKYGSSPSSPSSPPALRAPKPKVSKYKTPNHDILHEPVYKYIHGRRVIETDQRATFLFLRMVRPDISVQGEYCQEPYNHYFTGREWESERIHAKSFSQGLIKKQLDKLGFDELFMPNGLLEPKEGKGFNAINYNMRHAHEVGKSLICFQIYLQQVPDPLQDNRPMRIYSLHENQLSQ